MNVLKWMLIVVVSYLIGVIIFAPKSELEILEEHQIAAQKIYKFNCAMCHGNLGQGNGPTAAAMNVRPPNWSNPNWQMSVTDRGIRQAIVGGGASIGRNELMPAHPHLNDTAELEALVKLIRGFED